MERDKTAKKCKFSLSHFLYSTQRGSYFAQSAYNILRTKHVIRKTKTKVFHLSWFSYGLFHQKCCCERYSYVRSHVSAELRSPQNRILTLKKMHFFRILLFLYNSVQGVRMLSDYRICDWYLITTRRNGMNE